MSNCIFGNSVTLSAASKTRGLAVTSKRKSSVLSDLAKRGARYGAQAALDFCRSQRKPLHAARFADNKPCKCLGEMHDSSKLQCN
jgi:hypothetical protein